MTRQDDNRPEVGSIGVLDEVTIGRARHTAAEHALDAADLALLLAVLGIGSDIPEPVVEELEEVAPQDLCECGCDDPMSCRRLVPVVEVREVVARIMEVTGQPLRTVARRAGIEPGCLKAALRSSVYPRRTTRGNLAKLQFLAAAVNA